MVRLIPDNKVSLPLSTDLEKDSAFEDHTDTKSVAGSVHSKFYRPDWPTEFQKERDLENDTCEEEALNFTEDVGLQTFNSKKFNDSMAAHSQLASTKIDQETEFLQQNVSGYSYMTLSHEKDDES